MIHFRALIAGFLFVVNAAFGNTADLILFGGEIVTVDDKNPSAEAIAVKDGKILYVGEKEQAFKFKDDHTEFFDLQGKTLLPGFVGAHTHIIPQGIVEQIPNIGPFNNKTIDDVINALTEAAQKGPVLVTGFDPLVLKEPGTLDKEQLDRISTNIPILVINVPGHTAYGNSAALEQAGVTATNAKGFFGWDAAGNLNGIAYDTPAIFTLVNGFAGLIPLDYVEISKKMVKEYALKGFTTVTDMSLGLPMPTSLEHIQVLRDAANASDAPVRIQGYVVYPLLSQIADLRKDDNERFKINGVKIWIDGSLQNYTAALLENYKGEETLGRINYTIEHLQQMVLDARKENIQIAVHADGDRAIGDALTAFENAQEVRPSSDPRFRIEQATLTDKYLIRRMSAVLATPSFTNLDVYYWGKAFKDTILGEPRANNIDAAKSANLLGMKFSFNDDAPLAGINPLLLIQIGVTREISGDGVLNPDEAISVDDAIKAVTIYPAWQSFREKEIGSLEVGKFADFVLLDKNPQKVKSAQIGSIKVLGTWLQGKKVN